MLTLKDIGGIAAILFVLGPSIGVAAKIVLPDHAAVAYAAADPAGSGGHLLDIYLPEQPKGLARVVLWSAGSAWMADDGRTRAEWMVENLTPLGYAVVGVSVRSSAQAIFPAQLYDVKAAIRFIKVNAEMYGLDANRIAVVGTSSGGWLAAMAAVTQDLADLEGDVGVSGPPSTIQAAVAFWPPTNFLSMDAWAVQPCEHIEFMGTKGFCHDHPQSPESRLVGCPIQSCPEAVKSASPINYVSRSSAPLLILHGQSDPLVPHSQGEALYQAYNKACADAVFVSIPKLGHGPLAQLMTDAELAAGTAIRSTTAENCVTENPRPIQFGARTLFAFLNEYLGGGQ